MLSDVDYYFNYKYLSRFLLVHKVGTFSNSYALPQLRALILGFNLNELLDLEDPRIFNYFFLFRFFFGNGAFFTNYRSRFSLGKTYYSFQVQSFFAGRRCFFPVFFLANDLAILAHRNTYSYFFEDATFIYAFYDMNFFLEKKNNVGLFNLRNHLRYTFYFSSRRFSFYRLLVNLLKVI